jgi:divinyl chlorophyllide a 8-vinyl-reductase
MDRSLPHAPLQAATAPSQRIMVLGATGTIGRATVQALLRRGHAVVGLVRDRQGVALHPDAYLGAELRLATITDPHSLARDGFKGERFDAMVSCLASRTGVAADAWAIDHQAHVHALAAAQAAGVRHVVLLSALCVQKPMLAFQQAKLAFEHDLIASGLTYSIVRPTAFFKSLSGQVARVKQGKPYVVFGDGELTACKPISDFDLANYLVRCLDDPALHNRVLPIGGPGPAMTPKQQGAQLFALAGQPARYTHVPVAMLHAVVAVLRACSRLVGPVWPALAAKAELATIGRYYATESMLVWDAQRARYDEAATPSTGADTLREHHAALLRGDAQQDRGAHTVF